MDRSNTNTYWHQPDVNSSIKSHLKVDFLRHNEKEKSEVDL